MDESGLREVAAIAWLTARVSGSAVALAALIGVPLGAWLGLARFRGKAAVATLARAGMALPPVLVGLVLYLALSREGPLGGLGWLFTGRSMVLAQATLAVPFTLGITMAAVEAVPTGLLAQARSLGASPRQVRLLALREARAGVVLALATATGRSLSEVGAVLIVGGNIRGETRVLTTAIVLEAGRGRFGPALAMGGILLAAALAANAALIGPRGRPGP